MRKKIINIWAPNLNFQVLSREFFLFHIFIGDIIDLITIDIQIIGKIKNKSDHLAKKRERSYHISEIIG